MTWKVDIENKRFYREFGPDTEYVTFKEFEAQLMHCYLPEDLEEILTELVVLRELAIEKYH